MQKHREGFDTKTSFGPSQEKFETNFLLLRGLDSVRHVSFVLLSSG